MESYCLALNFDIPDHLGQLWITPTAESTAPEVPTMIIDPILAIQPVSIPLCGEWYFYIDRDGAGEQQGWANPNFDDSSWATISVPHTWNVMSEHSKYEGLAWYRRSFTVPNESHDAYLHLRFEAVFYLARAWLNGQYLGQHEGGYTPFEFDVTSIIESGEKNVIAVQSMTREIFGIRADGYDFVSTSFTWGYHAA